MKRFLRLFPLAALMTCLLAVSAQAADYTVDEGSKSEFYPSTDYAETYGAEYRYGGTNAVDFVVPALAFGVQSNAQIGAMEKVLTPGAVSANNVVAAAGSNDGAIWHPAKNSFFDLDFNALDRNLSPAERQEWNSIYASYRSRSALSGTIIGMDVHAVSVRNQESGAMERREMFCAIVIPFRVKILIPETEMWYEGDDRPGFVLRNMVGANIDFVVLQVDREGGVAIASRRMAMDSRRYYFTHHPELHRENALVKCNLLSVGPRRCLAECYGYDLNLTQREMRYTAIPDLRTEYSPGQELDCRIKHFDPAQGSLQISVKEVESNPFEGAELRHPVGSRRQAVIAGKYGGGVFCNLPDGTVCMCLYSYQYEDSDFSVGDKVIIIVKQYDNKKQQIYGKIVAKW